MSGNKLILKLDDAANTAAYNEALLYFESLGFRGKTASDLAIEKVHNNVLFDAGTLPDVDVVAKAWGDGDASRRENYQKARKAERESEEKALQYEMNQSIRNATDKWGKGIGSGLEIISSFTPLWLVAPAVRTGLDLSDGDYEGAALNAGLAFAAPYAVGKGILYVAPYAKSAIIASKLNRLINKTTLPLYSTRYYTKSVGLPGHVNYTLHNADGSVAGGLKVESPYSAGTRGTHIEMVHKTDGSKGGVSEDLYNIAVKDALRAGLPGVESGLDLMNPLLTKHVTSKFPNIEEMIGTPQMVKNPTTGKWEFKQTIPGRMLTGTTSKLLALEAPQGHFITNYSATATNTPSKTSLAFFERLPVKISKAEKAGIRKGMERTLVNNEEEILKNAKAFAEKYGYEIPETIDAAKAMYNLHNSFFRTPSNHESVILHYDPELAKFPLELLYFKLASKGYPESMRSYDFSRNGIYSDDFVFVAPDYGEVMPYINDVPAVMLRRPFRKSNPLTWHNDAEWIIQSKYTPYEQVFGKNKIGTAQIGNSGPLHEFKVSTRYLHPVKIALPTDKGTLLGVHLGPYDYKSGGSIHIKNKNKGKFSKVRDYVDYKNSK